MAGTAQPVNSIRDDPNGWIFMPWLVLFLAGLLEVVWAVGLKSSFDCARPFLQLGTILAIVGSMALLAVSMRNIPLGVAYAVWTSIGTIGTFLVGVMFFGESLTMIRLGSLILIILGVCGMKLAGDQF